MQSERPLKRFEPGGGRTYAWMENVAQKEMESVWLCLAVFYGIFSYIDSHFLV